MLHKLKFRIKIGASKQTKIHINTFSFVRKKKKGKVHVFCLTAGANLIKILLSVTFINAVC